MAGDIEGVEVEGRAVLFATGWDRHWRTDDYGNPDHSFVTAGLVEALVAGGVALVGIDSVNIDDTRGGARPAHTGLLEAGIPVVEHLTGLDRLVGDTVPVLCGTTEGHWAGDLPGARVRHHRLRRNSSMISAYSSAWVR